MAIGRVRVTLPGLLHCLLGLREGGREGGKRGKERGKDGGKEGGDGGRVPHEVREVRG